MKKLNMREIILVCKHAVRYVLRSRKSDFSGIYGTAGGEQYVAGGSGLSYHGSRLPLLGVAALGISRQDGLLELSSRVGKRTDCFSPASCI